MELPAGTLVPVWLRPKCHQMGICSLGGISVMSVADAIHDYRERSLPHLARLGMLSAGETEAVASPGVAAEVSRATRAVLTQAQAASRLVALAAIRGGKGDQGPGLFLAARLARLTAAADDAVAAARSGNAAVLRERLLRFDALTSAIWTAQRAAHEWAVPPPRTGKVA